MVVNRNGMGEYHIMQPFWIWIQNACLPGCVQSAFWGLEHHTKACEITAPKMATEILHEKNGMPHFFQGTWQVWNILFLSEENKWLYREAVVHKVQLLFAWVNHSQKWDSVARHRIVTFTRRVKTGISIWHPAGALELQGWQGPSLVPGASSNAQQLISQPFWFPRMPWSDATSGDLWEIKIGIPMEVRTCRQIKEEGTVCPEPYKSWSSQRTFEMFKLKYSL